MLENRPHEAENVIGEIVLRAIFRVVFVRRDLQGVVITVRANHSPRSTLALW